MNQFVSHIEFLLHEHNCVIIPNLGGFVVNTTPSRRDDANLFLPPYCELVFNRELTYNDGLLAESYMKLYDISFDSAIWKIENSVRELKQKVREQGSVELGKLGSFELIGDSRFRFTSGEFIRPSFFGLDQVQLKSKVKTLPNSEVPHSEIPNSEIPYTEVEISENKQRGLRSVGIAAAAAAAVILVMLFVLPMGDTAIGRQSAQIMYETEWLKPKQSQSAVVDYHATPAVNSETHSDTAPSSIPVSEITSKYYIIMGVFKGNNSSSKFVEDLKDKGFSDADCLERPGRYDVFAASFSSETAAEDFLREVHKKYPSHSDAWILKR